MRYNFDDHRKYLEGELSRENLNYQNLTESLKVSDAKINQIIGALETVSVIEKEQQKETEGVE